MKAKRHREKSKNHLWLAFAGRTNVEFKSYAKLNHLFLEGSGPASDADYVRPRNIPKYVIDDVVTWIKKH